MKKTIQKMKLNRETLRSLDPENLKGAAGGFSQQQCSGPTYCFACITIAAASCPHICT